MVPPSSHRVSRVRRYSGYSWLTQVFAYVTLTLSCQPSHAVLLTSLIHITVQTPSVFLLLVWPLPLSLATTHRISFDFFSSPYLDVSVQAVPLCNLWIQLQMTGLPPAGLLHSDIHASMPTYGSTWLFAVSRVLLRLPVPRHSPCALCSLTMLSNLGSSFCLIVV